MTSGGRCSKPGQVIRILRSKIRRLHRSRRYSEKWMNGRYVSTEDPVLIGGAGRSGNTLLSVMLNAHPEVFCGPEYGLLLAQDFSLDKIAANLQYDRRILAEMMHNADNRWMFLERLIRLMKTHHNVSRLVTKKPTYVFDLASIFDAFPNARFVYICRDGRDVAVSMRENAAHIGLRYDATYGKDGLLSMKYCAESWRTFANAYRSWEKDGRCCVVRYEGLVFEPETVLRELCTFLTIPYQANMLRFYEEGLEGRPDASRPHHTGLSRPLYQEKTYRWRQALSSEQVRTFERYAGGELRHLGYPCIGNDMIR